MTNEELEKKAEEYADNEVPFDTTESGEKLYTKYDVKEAYIAGAKENEQLKQEYEQLKQELEEFQRENEQLKAQIEKMKCCCNCDGWDYLSTGERDCIETCCSNRSNWRLRDRSYKNDKS